MGPGIRFMRCMKRMTYCFVMRTGGFAGIGSCKL
jgi:hypothetical protein